MPLVGRLTEHQCDGIDDNQNQKRNRVTKESGDEGRACHADQGGEERLADGLFHGFFLK